MKKYIDLVKKDFQKSHNLIWVRIGNPVRTITGWQGVLAQIILVLGYLIIQFYWSIISACLRTAHAAIDSVAGYWRIR